MSFRPPLGFSIVTSLLLAALPDTAYLGQKPPGEKPEPVTLGLDISTADDGYGPRVTLDVGS
jgi:hypothetical protein